MARVSNGIITFLNLLTLVLGICAIGLSFWLYVKVGSSCERVLRMPLLVLGGSLLAISMAGLLGSCCRLSFFMWLYLITLFLLIVGLTAFTIFVLVVTNQGVGNAFSGKAGVEDYSLWLQNYVINAQNWDKIKSCFIEVKLCHSIQGVDQEISKHISPIQSGCCKPPKECGVQLKNATAAAPPPEPDCTMWSNEQTELCLNCESCKTATLENIKKEWRVLAIINACVLVLVALIYSIGCCALRNNQTPGFSKYTNYYA